MWIAGRVHMPVPIESFMENPYRTVSSRGVGVTLHNPITKFATRIDQTLLTEGL